MDPAIRYAPEKPFPPYAFVPGRHPHPIRDPEGHSFGQEVETLPAPLPGELAGNIHFRFGLDLFNFGYYWEAHEAWEELWHAAGRKGNLADLLKGLIHLAAAGVKAREGNPNGVIRHARRAGELFRITNRDILRRIAEELASEPPADDRVTTDGFPLLAVRLGPEDFSNL